MVRVHFFAVTENQHDWNGREIDIKLEIFVTFENLGSLTNGI